MNWRLVSRLAWRDLRSGEIALLVVALMVAVGTVTSISLFVDRLKQALILESATFLAADRQISGSREIPREFLDQARSMDLETAETLVFPSMVFSGDRNQLVSVKAVDSFYPLRGELIAGDQPFQRGFVAQTVPQPGFVWLDARLFPSLGVQIGDEVEVGLATLKVSKVLVSEPDRGGSFFDLGPRLLMNVLDVPATEVVQPGSRLSYRLLLKGDEADLEQLKEKLELKPNFRWVSVKESSPRIGSALDRAESFLLLGGLLAVLLAGVAVALSANRYARRHMDHVGVLKTLGATPKQIWVGFLNILLFVGLISVLLGLFFGVSLHILIVELLASLIPVELPAPGPRPLVLGAITGLICALSFAMPAFVHLRNISPMRVLRRDLDISPASRLLSYGAAILGSLTLLVWYTESLFLTFWSLLGIVSVLVFFGLVAVVLLRGTGIAGMQAKSGWRLALAGLQRRKNENIAQMLIFGLAIMLLLVLVLIRTSLIEEWEAQVPKDAPNHFLMNINAGEVESIGQLIRTRASKANEIYPMIRGRVNQVNEVEAKEWQKKLERPYEGVRISSERNLTWLESLPENNEIVAGEWWGPQTTEPLVSLEEEYANDLGLGLGDRIVFDIGGKLVETQVASIRRLEWESMSPNFFIIFSPASLSDFSATYMTSFFLEKEDKRFLNDILSQHPTTTVIEIDALIEQVQKIVGQVTQAVELVMFLVLFSGCLVLLASIQASRDTRIAELALVRALGGTKKLIGGSLFVEFLLLGTMAGVVAVVGAEMTVALLQAQIFDLSFNLHPWLWLLGPVAGGLIITLVGYFGSRGLLDAPPMNVLRGA